MNESEIFGVARKLSGGERNAYLSHICADNAQLRSEVEALLNVDIQLAQDSTFKGQAAVNDTQKVTLNTVFAERYKLKSLLGMGGMGAVYLAEQFQPVQRLVAIKIIREQFTSNSLLARFELERQALARMDHPGIAKVYDAGVASLPSDASELGAVVGNVPYYVMEYIEGTTITKYCNEKKLGPLEKIDLFIQVCQAVQHAHQKGMIHRDLKPSNILIGLYDGKPVPKIIDFGVAKATERFTNQSGVQTESGALLGTLEYMAPEQADLGNTDIDTRADIYALGVILYELITGGVPISRKVNQPESLFDFLRMIQEQEPLSPSAKLLKTASGTSTSLSRKTLVTVQGDLDCIILKSLEKSRSLRYETAESFAQDLRRFLTDEPILARPASTSYRWKKWLRKHRFAVLAAGLVVCSLLLGIIGTSWGLLAAQHKADEESKAKEQALVAEKLAKERLVALQKEQEKVIEQSDLTKAINDFVLIDIMNQTSVEVQQDRIVQNISLKDAVKRSAVKIEKRFAGKPALEAKIRRIVGKSLWSLGDYAECVSHFEKAMKLQLQLKDQPAQSLALAKAEYGNALISIGQFAESIPYLEESYAELVKLVGPKDHDRLYAMYVLGIAWINTNQLDKAEKLFEEMLAIQSDGTGTGSFAKRLDSMHGLVAIYRRQKNVVKARELQESLIAQLIKNFGEEHAYLLKARNMLAQLLFDEGKKEAAIALYDQIHVEFVRVHSADHPDTALHMYHFGASLRGTVRNPQAIELLRKAIKVFESKRNESDPILMDAYFLLGRAYLAGEEYEQAKELLTLASDRRSKYLGESNQQTLNTMYSLSECYKELGKYQRSIEILENIRSRMKVESKQVRQELAYVYEYQGNYSKAFALFEKIVAENDAASTPEKGNPRKQNGTVAFTIYTRYLGCMEQMGNLEGAAPLRRQMAQEQLQAGQIQSHLVCLAYLGVNLVKQKKNEELEKMLSSWKEAEAKLPSTQANPQFTAFIRSSKGYCLTSLKKYDEAEKELLFAEETFRKNRPAKPKPYRINEHQLAIERLVGLYKEWNKEEERKKWEKELLPTSKN